MYSFLWDSTLIDFCWVVQNSAVGSRVDSHAPESYDRVNRILLGVTRILLGCLQHSDWLTRILLWFDQNYAGSTSILLSNHV